MDNDTKLSIFMIWVNNTKRNQHKGW